MGKKKRKISRLFLTLQEERHNTRKRGMILNDFIEGRVGVLRLDDWMQLYEIFENHYVRNRILRCVRMNIQSGHIFLGSQSVERSRIQFLSKVFK